MKICQDTAVTKAIKHYGETKNECVGNFDPKNYSRYIEYLGIINQYRKVVSESILFAGFIRILEISAFAFEFIMNYDKNSEFGYTQQFK